MDYGSSAHPKGGTAFYELGRGQLYTERQVRLIYKKSTLTLRDTVIKWTAMGPDYEYPLRHVSLGWTGVYSKTTTTV